ATERPITTVIVAAVLRNPWAGLGFVDDLRPEILRLAPMLGTEMTRRLVAVMPADRVEAYGKAATVGVNGEIEHGSALIHTLRFGNMFREAVSGTAFLSFTNTRVGPGALLSVPMIHKSETGKRSHFLTATFQMADAPGPDEILIAIGASDGGRAHPRIADRFQDMAEMEAEKANA
ncbi:amino acid synthesis family protein, partial [Paraburkholderia sp. SIMBA_049]